MKKIFFILFFFPFIKSAAQECLPGGVTGMFLWEVADFPETGKVQWKSRIGYGMDSIRVFDSQHKSINHNPALYINEGLKNFSVNLKNLDAFSFFTVCQENDSLTEKVILSLENDTSPEMVLTNRRLAATDIYRYANYSQVPVSIPKIYSYIRNKSSDSLPTLKKLRFGYLPVMHSLPVSSYKGVVPEMILFNRPVSHQERQKVESYLALKYGITLNQEFPSSYLNSKGEIIWDALRNVTHNRNIAGIGCDDISGLHQKVSESCQSLGLVRIRSLNNLVNNTFIIWGDNGGEACFNDQTPLRRLGREWKVSSFNTASDSVLLEIDLLNIKEINPLNSGETFWLMIDRSASGKYPFKQTDFTKCSDNVLKTGKIQFENIVFGTHNSRNDFFTLAAAPAFFSRNTVLPSSCIKNGQGAVLIDIAGGIPPYTITIENADLNYRARITTGEKSYSFDNLEQGLYELSLVDANNSVFNEKVRISNSQAWETKVRPVYKLTGGNSLGIDASTGMPANNYSYSWTVPGGSVVSGSNIRLSECGSYILTITDENNCKSVREIKVLTNPGSLIRNTELYPNPSFGSFIIRAELDKPADITISVQDLTGKVIKQSAFKNDYYYWTGEKLQEPGTYIISILAGNEQRSMKLVVQ